MSNVLREMVGKFVIDSFGVLMYSDCVTQHVQPVKRLPNLIIQNHLFAKAEKIEFSTKTRKLPGLYHAQRRCCQGQSHGTRCKPFLVYV